MTEQKKRKGFDPKSLPYLAATAQAVQFGHAGYILLGWIGAAIGGIVGTVVSFSVAYAGSQIASVNGQKREKWANTATLLLICLSPLVIATPVYISFSVIENDVLRWVTACSWALAPDLAILLNGLITGKKLVAAEEKPATATTETQTEPKKGKEKPVAKPLLTDETLQAWFLQHPGKPQVEAAKHFQVSHTAISKRAQRIYGVAKVEKVTK